MPDETWLLVIRWTLRAVLGSLLAWLLLRMTPAQQEEKKPPERKKERNPAARRDPGVASTNWRDGSFDQKPPQQAQPRQRRTNSGAAGGASAVDDILSKMSKPREQWAGGDGTSRRPEDTSGKVPGSKEYAGDRARYEAEMRRQQAGVAGGNFKPKPIPGMEDSPAAKRQPLELKKAGNKKTGPGSEVVLHGHGRPITCIVFADEGKKLVTCGKDGNVCLWELPSGDRLGKFEGHNGAVWGCSVSADDRWLATCGGDMKVMLWSMENYMPSGAAEGGGIMKHVQFNRDAAVPKVATCSQGFGQSNPPCIAVLSYTENGQNDGVLSDVWKASKELPSKPTQVLWGKGDATVLSSHEGGELCIWDAASGALSKVLPLHTQSIKGMDLTEDLSMAITASHDHTMKLVNLEKGDVLHTYETDRPLNDTAIGNIPKGGPDRPTFFVLAAGGVDARDVATTNKGAKGQFETLVFAGKESAAAESVPGHFGPVHTLATAPGGCGFATGGEDGCVRLHFVVETFWDGPFTYPPRGAEDESVGDAHAPAAPATPS
mmetsp:Transcript_50844/g.111329  ORF Transcript_50844/g.111329 Transcript_50844/m.111329 type:complete len:546 (+) Transcript_50844:429-2066(+)